MRPLLGSILSLLLLGNCAPKHVSVAEPHVSADGTYVYWRDPDGQIIIVTKQAGVVSKAAKDLDCGTCTVDNLGQMYVLSPVGGK